MTMPPTQNIQKYIYTWFRQWTTHTPAKEATDAIISLIETKAQGMKKHPFVYSMLNQIREAQRYNEALDDLCARLRE